MLCEGRATPQRERATIAELAHNAAPMRKEGSNAAPLPAWLAPPVVVLGVGSMLAVAPHAGRLGLRPGLLISELALLAPGLLALALARRSWRPVLGGRPGRRPLLWAAAAGVTLWLASLGLFELQYSVWSPPPGYLEAFRLLHERLRPSGAWDALASVLAIALAPAICEELLFRGLVLPSLLRPLGAVGASVVTAALFGLIHLDATSAGALSLYRVPFAFAVGLGFAALRLLAGGLWAPVAAHATLNALTFAAAPFADDPGAGLPEARPLLGAVILAAGLVSTLLALRRLRTQVAPDGSSLTLSR